MANNQTGKLEVTVAKEALQWSKAIKESKGFIEFVKNFPRVHHGVEVEVMNIETEQPFYFNTNCYGEISTKLPTGNYNVRITQGDHPAKRISILPGKKSKVYFSLEEGKYKK